MANAACLAHPARRDDDVEAAKARDRLALLDAFGEAHIMRIQRAHQLGAIVERAGVLLEDRRSPGGERRVDEDRRLLDVAALHQRRDVDEQFLRALDREGRNDQRAVSRHGAFDFRAQQLAALLFG